MKKIRPIFLLSFLIFLLSVPYEIFATNNKNVLDLERSRELLLDGYIQSDFDNHQLAIEYYSEAIRLNPNNFYAFLNRAFSRHQIKDNPGAWDDLNRALEINPNHGIASYNRAIVNWKLGHQLSSIKDYSRAIELDPEFKNAYFNRAYARINQEDIKKFEIALQDFKKYIEIEPIEDDNLNEYISFHYSVANSYSFKNKNKKAA